MKDKQSIHPSRFPNTNPWILPELPETRMPGVHHIGPSRIAFTELFLQMPSAFLNVITRNSPMKSIIMFRVKAVEDIVPYITQCFHY